MKREGKVFVKNIYAGNIWQDENGFVFIYASAYIKNNSLPVSLTMPIREEPYTDSRLFPFFDGLIPEGWLLDLVEKNWKINERDRMGLLLAACRDCIGVVHIEPEDEQSENN